MPEKVLVYSRFPKSLMQRIGDQFDLLDAGGRPPHEVFVKHELDQLRAMITQGSSLLNGEMMDRFPKLGAIVCYGTGYDGIDLQAASRRGIAVGHSPGANASSVADIAITLMLGAIRRLVVADGYVRSGDWAAAKPSPMMRAQQGIRGRKVGLYGMGAIGRKIAARVAAFEAEVAYFSRSRHDDLPYQYFPSLDALADWCSVLVIAVRAGPETHYIVNAGILKRLGEDGYVVNIARGSVIDEDALVAALKDKIIAGAGLDVYAKEPYPPGALTAFPNVVLTPHIGGHTLESHRAMQDCVIANLAAFFQGKPLPYAVV
ncbi:2-hydroxyacid dehydrogenase [Bradyrhizobium sp. ARR65]|uniref:2-hydroxyacid dehydrogenase n=1 Tax=Bradyrhizobium sp. ARR65 TaxID=1040989 RepID=UPI000462F93F|nr:2-hydroxyacid dehydrogenase [Bradyrhizobium sp. ARR65]